MAFGVAFCIEGESIEEIVRGIGEMQGVAQKNGYALDMASIRVERDASGVGYVRADRAA